MIEMNTIVEKLQNIKSDDDVLELRVIIAQHASERAARDAATNAKALTVPQCEVLSLLYASHKAFSGAGLGLSYNGLVAILGRSIDADIAVLASLGFIDRPAVN